MVYMRSIPSVQCGVMLAIHDLDVPMVRKFDTYSVPMLSLSLSSTGCKASDSSDIYSLILR